jgi:hypothetical protein
MDTNDLPDTATARKLPWTTPRLEDLGNMRDAEANGAQPPNDGSASPSLAAS